MGKFTFRLQSLLNLKRQIEDGLKNDLGKAIGEYESQKRIFNKIENEKEAFAGQINTKSRDGASIRDLQKYSKYIEVLNKKAKRQMENVKNAKDNVDRYREKLIKASQEKKIIDKLRDKKYKEHLKEQLQKEQKINEEISSYKYIEGA
ncbi:flagellar export protein FliJ [Herbivorax sp. ANBcel31]|uniref:flagellar export protein FliJ n=1 Tax=Herbivorax sp. ANBcel31 TaxID=3069754 RepID=UPI0027AFEE24|nr:flagellar export protein FliJ [Herbivorax sp. ANBcel31]MDQ2085893.1 flagellar export protein FliJ [Herbivorax sp. ANBcel31]